MSEHRPPLSVFGIPVKLIVCGVVIMIGILADFDSRIRHDAITRFTPPQHEAPSATTSGERNLLITPEMIEQARREIIMNRLAQQEFAVPDDPTDRFLYQIELHSGGTIDTFDLTIRPQEVIVLSPSGVQTSLPREAIKQIHRFKLPADQP